MHCSEHISHHPASAVTVAMSKLNTQQRSRAEHKHSDEAELDSSSHSRTPPLSTTDMSSSSSSATSSSIAPSSSDWTHLPTVMLAELISYSTFRDVVHVALANRRLHELLLMEPSSTVSSHTNLWCKYPPVTFHLLLTQSGRERRGSGPYESTRTSSR